MFSNASPRKIRLPVRNRKLIATVLLLASVATEYVGISMGLPVLAQYAASFGIEESYVGLVFSVGAFSGVLSELWLPFISDIFGRKLIVVLSLVGSAVAYAMQALAPSFEFLLIALFIGGMFGGTQPVAVAYISDIYSPTERPRFIGMVPACASFCFTFGPTLGGMISNTSGSYRVPLAVSSALVACMLPVVVIFLPDSKLLIGSAEKHELNKAEAVAKRRMSSYCSAGMDLNQLTPSESSPLLSDVIMSTNYRGPLLDWQCYMCSFVSLFHTAAFASFTTCIPLVLAEPVFGLQDDQAAVFWTGIVIGCGAVSQSLGLILFFDRMQKRIGLTRTIIVGTTASFLSYVFLSFQKSVQGMAIGFAIYTWGGSLTRPGIYSRVTLIVPREFTARAIAMPNVATSLGQMIAPVLSTQLLAIWDYLRLFQLVSAMLFVQLLITVTFIYRDRSKCRSAVGEAPAAPNEEDDVESEPQLISRMKDILQQRNYDLSDKNTKKVIIEMVLRSFPYLRESVEDNKNDVEGLMDELNIPRSFQSPDEIDRDLTVQYTRRHLRHSIIATNF